jgi:hypothetical protein
VHRLLGVASQEAQRSNYASAAQTAARFFDEAATLARVDIRERANARVALLSYTAQRDEIMALPARAIRRRATASRGCF